MNKNIKKVFAIICIITYILFGSFTHVYADSAPPMPSISINVKGIKGRSYVTVLTDCNISYDEQEDEIDRIFLDYNDDYYYCGEYKEMSTDGVYEYYLYENVDSFKFIIYDVASHTFKETQPYKYNHNAEYEYNFNDNNIITSYATYYYSIIKNITISIAVTVCIELFIASLFKIFDKKSKIVIVVVNIVSQLLLFFYFYSADLYLITLIIGELLVFVIETFAYCLLLKYSKARVIIYTLVANLCSLFFGTIISLIILSFF